MNQKSTDQGYRIEQSADGSQTVFSHQFGQHFHSMHGALSESEHVFIQEGLSRIRKQSVHILEMGFGSGLNALLSLREAEQRQIDIHYRGLELHPLPEAVWSKLKFDKGKLSGYQESYGTMHRCSWERDHQISSRFTLVKNNVDMLTADLGTEVDLIYFDAFGPGTQPELWSDAMIDRMHACLAKQGVITTYSCKGDVRRAMAKVGFQVLKVKGPPGKRSMLVGIKE